MLLLLLRHLLLRFAELTQCLSQHGVRMLAQGMRRRKGLDCFGDLNVCSFEAAVVSGKGDFTDGRLKTTGRTRPLVASRHRAKLLLLLRHLLLRFAEPAVGSALLLRLRLRHCTAEAVAAAAAASGRGRIADGRLENQLGRTRPLVASQHRARLLLLL
jgi:hypothetical protein